MSKTFDVCVHGAGIVGQTLALLLAKERLRVALRPAPSKAHSTDVRAYALNAASKSILESLRVWPERQHATPITAMEVHGDASGMVNFSAAEHGAGALAWVVDVPALEEKLSQAVKFQPLIEVLASDAPATPVVQAELTVVCEGKNSLTRQTLGVDFDVTPYNQHAIAARLQGAYPHGGIARQWFRDGEILALLPLSDAIDAVSDTNMGEQGNSVALVWSVSPERAQALMALSQEEFSDTVAQACGMAMGKMQLYSERAVWPLQLARANKWVGRQSDMGTWALAGDAAHTVHPLSGQGLNLGLGDVAELAKVLSSRPYWRSVGDLKLLRAYERARKLQTLTLGTVTDGLQQLFARDTAPVQALRNWGMQGFEHSGIIKQWVTKRAMGL